MGIPCPDDLPGLSSASQTAQDYITSQLSLEADAREALPYQFDTCTKPLGPLRQSVYACLTCSPPPASPHQQYTPAGVCYSCSISCHGEHNLVELFCKRNFVCDCGTTRLETSATPCNLRINETTGRKGDVIGEEAHPGNRYNQNFQGRFCGCGEEYDPELEKGTMYQCLGLGTAEEGGCGEDWWHPECLLKLPRHATHSAQKADLDGESKSVKMEPEESARDVQEAQAEEGNVNEPETPAGFPNEDDFDHLICYKCADAFPWIKQYAGTPGFLAAVSASGPDPPATNGTAQEMAVPSDPVSTENKKRKAEDSSEDCLDHKKSRTDDAVAAHNLELAPPAQPPTTTSTPASDLTSPSHTTTHTSTSTNAASTPSAKHLSLPSFTTSTPISIFLHEDFRLYLCRCAACFPTLARHPQLLEEEETYEPPVSEPSSPRHATGGSLGGGGGHSVHSGGSLLDRGEAALSSMDRVRAIEGVMAYNHVRDKVKAFLQPFAESGQAVGAEDIKAYFAKLRGDDLASRAAGVEGAAASGDGGGESDRRREQGGY